MKTISESATIHVDYITAKVDTGELSKLALTLGYDLEMTRSEEMSSAVQARLRRRPPGVWLSDEIAYMVAVESLGHDRPVDDVLRDVRSRLERLAFPMNGKPSDSRGLGEGPIDSAQA